METVEGRSDAAWHRMNVTSISTWATSAAGVRSSSRFAKLSAARPVAGAVSSDPHAGIATVKPSVISEARLGRTISVLRSGSYKTAE